MGAKEKYIAMFNAGYLMQQYEPQLLKEILKLKTQHSEYLKLLTMGKQQHEREKIMREQQRSKEKRQEKKRGR